MHIHLPKPLHGWREFAGELSIIVLGILIALAAEQAIEDLHWRDKIGRAEQAMRIELSEDDGPQAYARLLIGRCLNERISALHIRSDTAQPEQLRQWVSAYSPPFRVWDNEAWKLVVASDVASRMDAQRAIAWSAPYRVIPTLNDTAIEEQHLLVSLRNALPPTGKASATDLRSLRLIADQLHMLNRRTMASSRLFLARIRQQGAEVPPPIQAQLTRAARALYGSCVTVPNLAATAPADRLDADLKSASDDE